MLRELEFVDRGAEAGDVTNSYWGFAQVPDEGTAVARDHIVLGVAKQWVEG